MRDSQHKALRAWAYRELVRLADDHPNDEKLQWFATQAALARAIDSVESDPKGAKATLKRLLPQLAAPDAIPVGNTADIGRYNRAVTAARKLKLKVKAPYRTKPARTLSALLEMDIPIGTGWKRQPVSGDQEDLEWKRVGPGATITILRVWKYDTDTDYKSSDGTVVGGDNVGGRRKMFLESAQNEMRKIRRSKPKIRACSRHLVKVSGFEVRGVTPKGNELRVREWYFKTKKRHGHALNICAREYGEVGKSDPETDFILSTMREPDR